MELINARTGKKERLGHLYVMMGKEATDVKSAKAGDIIVVPKLAETRTGDTISLTGEIAVDPLPLPVPQYPVAIEAVNKKEEDKLGTFLARAAENDPSIHIQRNEETHQTVLTAMGDTQVDMLISPAARSRRASMFASCPCASRTARPSARPPRRKAATRSRRAARGSSATAGCASPRTRGRATSSSTRSRAALSPAALFPRSTRGVQETMKEGVLAGYPMVDIKVAVFDGSYHSVDSNEMAFKTAARIGFRAACDQADPSVLLEPMADLEITVGEDYAGPVMGDISTRRGRIVGTDSNDEGETVIIVRVPYAEVVKYTKDLRSITRGSGSYSIQINGYEQAPADVTKKLVEEYQASRAAGN